MARSRTHKKPLTLGMVWDRLYLSAIIIGTLWAVIQGFIDNSPLCN